MGKENCKDRTSFWLAWRETCAIRRCIDPKSLVRSCAAVPEVAVDPEGVAAQARDIMRSTNRALAALVRMPRSVKSLKGFLGTDPDGLKAPEVAEEELASSDDGHDGPARTENAHAVDDGGHLRQEGGRSPFSAMDESDDDVVARARIHRGNGVLPNAQAKLMSEYSDYVHGWLAGSLSDVSAFELIEQHLYAKCAEGVESGEVSTEPMVDGRKLKDYLFEDIGRRPGGLNKNLWGYLLKKDVVWANGRPYPSRLRQVANESFRQPVVSPREDGGGASDEVPGNGGGDQCPSDVTPQEVQDAVKSLHVFLAASSGRSRWADVWDVRDRIAACCLFFHYTLSDPFVLGLAKASKSSLADRQMKVRRELRGWIEKSGLDEPTLLALFRGWGPNEVREIALTCPVKGGVPDPACRELFAHFGNLSD